jgi:hypothetical protein
MDRMLLLCAAFPGDQSRERVEQQQPAWLRCTCRALPTKGGSVAATQQGSDVVETISESRGLYNGHTPICSNAAVDDRASPAAQLHAVSPASHS